MTLPVDRALAALPVPEASIFRVPESTHVTMLARASSARRAESTAQAPLATEVSAKLAGKSRRHGHTKKNARSVRVAGFKKR
jgi:hypothetical protein